MISIIFSTNRKEPCFDWFCDSLYNQTGPQDREQIKLVFIDYVLGKTDDKEARHKKVFDAVGGRFSFTHTTPKPNLYQGETRKTKTELFSPANARNTGYMFSEGDYVVFVDDVAVLMPSWWGAVWQAYVHRRITCGSYWKHYHMDVDNGNLVNSVTHEKGRDSRWFLLPGVDRGPVVLPGGSLYGCSFGITSEAFERVNGFDEMCDSIGGEDYHLGIRLNNAGYKIYYDRTMYSVESEELHVQDYLMLRDDRLVSDEQYMARLNEFGISSRTVPGRADSSHMILDILHGKRLTRSFYNNYDVAQCRNEKRLPAVPDETHHWFDKLNLAEL